MRDMNADLREAQNAAYSLLGLNIDKVIIEAESQEYSALDFEMNGMMIKFRTGKITPTKVGQFVTLWKRLNKGPIIPFDKADPIDLFVISVRREGQLGQFVFTKEILLEKGVLSSDKGRGKLAIRIYPPWDVAVNAQAKRTQAWQLPYFFEIPSNSICDLGLLKKLFSMK